MIEGLGVLWLNWAVVVATFSAAVVLALAIKTPEDYLQQSGVTQQK